MALASVTAAYESPSRPDVVLIGCEPQSIWTPLVVAQARGLFERQGLDARVLVFPNAESLFNAFCRDKHHVHFAAGKVGDLVLRATRGHLVSLVCEIGTSQGLDKVILKSAYQGLDDPALRGKRIACKKRTMDHYFLYVALQTYRLRCGDFDVIDMSAPEAASAFIAGRVDGAVTSEPDAKIVHRKGGGRQVFTSADIRDGMPEGICAQDYLIQQHPDVVVKVLSAWLQALEWSDEHPKEFLEFAARKVLFRHNPTERDLRYYEDLVKRYRPGTISERMDNGGPVFAYCEEVLRFYRRIGAIGEAEGTLKHYAAQKLLIDNELFKEAIATYKRK